MPVPHNDGLGLPEVDLGDFLEHPLRKGMVVFRAHAANVYPLWFESSIYSRFDLKEPRGTCYLSRDSETAIAGMMTGFAGRGRNVSADHLRLFTITQLVITRPYRLANITAPRAKHFGAQKTLSQTVHAQEVTRAWAQSFADAGFDGVSYLHRFTEQGITKANAISIFGPSGHVEWPDRPGNRTVDVEEAARAAGFNIIHIPRRSHLTLI